MLVQGVEQVMPSRAPSILDSPTLARVERARMRQESGTATPERDSLQNNVNRFINYVSKIFITYISPMQPLALACL